MNILSKFLTIGKSHDINVLLAFQPDDSLVLTIVLKDRKDLERVLPPIQYTGTAQEVEERISNELEKDLQAYPTVTGGIKALEEKKAELEKQNSALEARIKANEANPASKKAAASTKGASKAKAKSSPSAASVTKELAPAPVPPKSPDGIKPAPNSQQPDLFGGSPATPNNP